MGVLRGKYKVKEINLQKLKEYANDKGIEPPEDAKIKTEAK